MADSVANLPISNSYVGLLRISNDATGASGSPVPVYTSDGAETVLSLGKNSATIDGSLTANNITVDNIIVTKTTTTYKLVVTEGTVFGNTITFSKVSTAPGVINEEGVIFENRGTFKSTTTGAIISEGTANFNTANFVTLTCSGDAIFDSNVSLGGSISNGILTIASNEITARGKKFTVTATDTKFNNAVTFNGPVNLGANATAVTPSTGDSSNKIATTSFVKAVTLAGTPVGTIQIYAGEKAPSGYLLCQGQSVSKTSYPALFAVIGTTYGGSGNNFNLPDFRGVFPRGFDAGRGVDKGRELGTRQPSGAPNITGQFMATEYDPVTGAFSHLERGLHGIKSNASHVGKIDFDASRCSSVYKTGLNEVRPVNIAVNFIIKY